MYLINYQNKWWYKSLTILVILAILFMISFGIAPKAKAIAILTATTAAVILAVLAGVGIATVTASLSSNDIQTWLNQKLNEWDTYRNDGNIFTDLIDSNLFVMTVRGLVAVGNGAARGITDFITWLQSDLGLTNNSSTVVISQGNVEVPYTLLSTSALEYVSWKTNGVYTSHSVAKENNDTIYIGYYQNNNLYSFIAFSDTPSTVVVDWYLYRNYTSSYITLSNSNNGIYYANLGNWNPSNYYNFHVNDNIKYYNSLSDLLGSIEVPAGSLTLDSDVIGIPDVTTNTDTDIVLGIGTAYPGMTLDDWTDDVLEGVVENTLDTTMTVTDELTDAQEVYVINEQPISVNTDHHMIGFVPPSWSDLHLSSIWHYVEEAIEYSEDFISWFVNLLKSMPILSIPLYMSFTLMIVIFFIRRIVL